LSGHSNWPEWIYVAVVIALMCWVGAEAWNAERLVEHVPEGAEIIKVQDSNGSGLLNMKMELKKLVNYMLK